MRIHVIQHVPYEGPESIAQWAEERGHDLATSMGPEGVFPPSEEVDFLVVMGGSMAADDEAGHPWLAAEKRFISDAIYADKLVLGVCLGAQILAEVLGGTVKRSRNPEIGWYPVRRTEASARDPLFGVFPDVLVVGHWHSDTFDLPDGIVPTLSSDATANQAFTANDGQVVGLQFHLEWTRDAVEQLADACGGELVDGGPYLTTAAEFVTRADRYLESCRNALFMLLDLMVSLSEGRG